MPKRGGGKKVDGRRRDRTKPKPKKKSKEGVN